MHYRVYLFEGDIAYNDVYKARHACNILTTFVAANTARVTGLALTGSSHKIFASLAIYFNTIKRYKNIQEKRESAIQV